MRNVVGGKSNVCPHCQGTMVYLNVRRLGTISQCLECNCTIQGRAKDEVQIYIYSEERQ